MQQEYIDSSVLVGILVGEISGVRTEVNSQWITSEISELECRRTLDRIRIQERLPDEEMAVRFAELELIFDAIAVVQLSPAVLKRAKAPFPTVVRSLDAIHLATAELAESKIFVTRDRQQSIAAQALNLKLKPL